MGTRSKGDVCVETYAPEDRALFEAQATGLYEEIATSDGIAAQDLRIQDDGDLHAGFTLLVRLGLVRLDGGWRRTPARSRRGSSPP